MIPAGLLLKITNLSDNNLQKVNELVEKLFNDEVANGLQLKSYRPRKPETKGKYEIKDGFFDPIEGFE